MAIWGGGSEGGEKNRDSDNYQADNPASPPVTSAAPRPTYELLESPRERNQRIKRLFDSIDRDNSGYLDANEIQIKFQSYAKSGAAGTESAKVYAQGLLERADTSQDGRVDLAEFQEFVVAQERELYNLFQEIDSSGDNEIELWELKQALESKGIEVSERSIQRFVSNVNQDGNATVSWAEFREAFALNPAAVDLISAFGYYQDLFGASVSGTEFIALPPDAAKAQGTRFKYIVASTISAAASRTCTAPMERIRVYLTLGGGEKRKPKWYSALTAKGRDEIVSHWRDTLRTISKDGGLLRGFWRGNMLSLIKVLPEASTRSLALGQTRVLMARMERVDDGMSISPAGRFAAGAMGGLVSTAVVYPIDLLRIRVMATVSRDSVEEVVSAAAGAAGSTNSTGSARSYHTLARGSGPLQRATTANWSLGSKRNVNWSKLYTDFLHDHPALNIAQTMLGEGGWKSFYRGFGLAIVGIVPYAGINLSVFETLKNAYLAAQATDERPHLLAILGIGCLAGGVAETAVYPLTVLRARMQSQRTVTNPESYASTADCFVQLWRSAGPRGLYRGLVPTLAKAAPGVGIGFTLFEISKDMLDIK